MDATVVESLIAMPLGAVGSNNASNSNTNLSCGSSSSSSNSSGYASATTTPTNPASAGSSSSHSQYSESHSTTPVGLVEPTPVATIAAITPYYNETFQQQQQQQHQQQQQLQQHRPQPQPQYATHQQYPHQTHSYQLTEQLQSPPAAAYNSHYDSYAYLGGADSYPQSTGVERNLLGMRHTTAFYTSVEKPSKLPAQTTTQLHSQTASNNNQIYNSSSNSESILNNQKRGSETSTSAKPQATATPFYAQPLQTSSPTAYLDPYKHKLPTKLPNHNIDYTNYSNQPVDATNVATYAQTFPQYHNGKALQDVAYGTSATQMKPLGSAVSNNRIPQQRLGVHYSNTGMPVGVTIGSSASNFSSSGAGGSGVGGGGIYLDKYDKYLFTAVTTAAQSPYYTTTQPANLSAVPYNAVTFATAASASAPAPPQYAAEIPNDPYRKTSPSSSWHWSMEYGNGNCRTLPPPHGGIPTAAIPPTNASYVPANATVAATNRDIYYTSEKYSSKYDKYNSYYNPHQQYVTASASGRNVVWPPNSPHASPHLVPTLADRLPHTYSHHATLPPSGMPTAIAPPPTHPALAYHHPYPPSAAAVAARQNCCSQSYQQQNCYYPRTAPHHQHFITNTYNPNAQAIPYGVSGTPTGGSTSNNNNNHAAKYGMTKVNTNDLYAATPTYDPTNINYHGYPTGIAHNQQYTSAVTPSAVVSHQTLNPNISTGPPSDISTAYYNDLNMQATYDTYMSPIQAPAIIQQRRESLVQRVDHLPNLPSTYNGTSLAKNSLIDFRKSTAIASEDSYMTETTLTNLDEHMASNMHHYHNNFGLDSELHPSDASMYGKGALDESTEKTDTPTTPTTKTYSSLRDFLSTWNEDEEDYGCTDERKLSEGEALQVVRQATGVDESTNRSEGLNKIPFGQESTYPADPAVNYINEPTEMLRELHEPLVEDHLHFKEAFSTRPKANVGNAADSPMDMVSNQYTGINLPDIVIDIEKSSGATSTNAKADIKDVAYDSFDVEKELDELETKRIKLSRKSIDTASIRTGSVIIKAESESRKSLAEGIVEKVNENATDKLAASIEGVNDIQLLSGTANPVALEKFEENLNSSVSKSELALSTVQAKPDSSYDRGNESDNTISSNGSTFEKEYETFINKIGNEFDIKPADSIESNSDANDTHLNISNLLAHSEAISNSVEMSETALSNGKCKTFVKERSQSELDIAQKIKSFSKFYKRKRKYSELLKTDEANNIKANTKDTAQHTNFPMVYTKRSRKRKENKIQLKAMRALKPKAYTFYQRTLRSLRRHRICGCKRLDTTALIQQHLATAMKCHLPLIKRSNINQFPTEAESVSKYFNPKTLKSLTVCFINSELFQNNLLSEAVLRSESVEYKVLGTAEEKKTETPKAMLEVATDMQHLNQTQDPKAVFEENQVKNDLRNEPMSEKYVDCERNQVENELRNSAIIEAHKDASDSGCIEEVSSQTDGTVTNHSDINKMPNVSETQPDKLNDTELMVLDVPEDMETNVFNEKADSTLAERTVDFVQEEMDINKCESEVINSPRHSATNEVLADNIEEALNLVTEVSVNSPMPRDMWSDPAPILICTEKKNVIDSSKVVDTSINESKSLPKLFVRDEEYFYEADADENSQSEVGDQTCSYIDDKNRLIQTEKCLKGSPEDLDVTRGTTAEVSIEKIENAVSDVEDQASSNKDKLNLINQREQNISRCSDGYSQHSEAIEKEVVEAFESEEAEIANMTNEAKDEELRLNQTKGNKNLLSEDSHLEAMDTTCVEIFECNNSEMPNLPCSIKEEETRLNQIEENINQFREGSSENFSLYSEIVNRVDIQLFENKTSEIETPIIATTNEETGINLNEENMYRSAENSPIKLTLHAEETNSMGVEIFENKNTEIMNLTYRPKDEESRLNQTKENMNDETEKLDLSNTTDVDQINDSPTEYTRLVNRGLDLYETENSVDMFGARKSAEYFTASSKNYFKPNADVDENSTDSSSTSSSYSSASCSDHRSTTPSSSSSCSSSSSSSYDENTQCSTTTVHSEFDEMKELEKELSQHQTNVPNSIQSKQNEKYTDQDDSNDKRRRQDAAVDKQTATENDIRTLKEILESDSDGREEMKTKLADVNENSVENETMHAGGDERFSEDKEIETNKRHAAVEDDVPMQDEDSIVLMGESVVNQSPMEANDCVASKLANKFAENSDVNENDNSSDAEYLERTMEVENEQSSTKYIIAAALEVNDESRVPSLKKILLDFLERENTIADYSIIDRTENELNSKIPKLSDLCKIALSSSFEISTTTTTTNTNTNTYTNQNVERELSVEEALAEMYRQAGVASDPEDGDAEDKEAQDLVVINLEEILVNDSDLYVLQCDMNENVLSVVTAHAHASDFPMTLNERLVGNIAEDVESEAGVKDVAQLANTQEEVGKVTNENSVLLEPLANIGVSVPQTSNEAALPYTTLPPTFITEFVEDEMVMMIANEQHIPDDSLDTQYDFPAIHHEEIVSHDSRRLKRQVLYNSLREKYVLKRVHFRPHHGNRVLKKYIHRWILQCLIARFRERELQKVQMCVEK